MCHSLVLHLREIPICQPFRCFTDQRLGMTGGYIDLEQKTLQPLDNPFGARLLPMS
jgi:hypothetical protein